MNRKGLTLLGLIGVEVTIGDETHGLACLDGSNADKRLDILVLGKHQRAFFDNKRT
jgi:hypothetical protein